MGEEKRRIYYCRSIHPDEDLPLFKFDLLDDEIIIFNLNNQPVQNPYLLIVKAVLVRFHSPSLSSFFIVILLYKIQESRPDPKIFTSPIVPFHTISNSF